VSGKLSSFFLLLCTVARLLLGKSLGCPPAPGGFFFPRRSIKMQARCSGCIYFRAWDNSREWGICLRKKRKRQKKGEDSCRYYIPFGEDEEWLNSYLPASVGAWRFNTSRNTSNSASRQLVLSKLSVSEVSVTRCRSSTETGER